MRLKNPIKVIDLNHVFFGNSNEIKVALKKSYVIQAFEKLKNKAMIGFVNLNEANRARSLQQAKSASEGFVFHPFDVYLDEVNIVVQ